MTTRTRRGVDTCCCFCAKRPWCIKTANKGRNPCTARQKSPECLTLVQSRWCTVCSMFGASLHDPNQQPLPGMEEAQKKEAEEVDGQPQQP